MNNRDIENLICASCQRLANIPTGHRICAECFEQHIMELEANQGREDGQGTSIETFLL